MKAAILRVGRTAPPVLGKFGLSDIELRSEGSDGIRKSPPELICRWHRDRDGRLICYWCRDTAPHSRPHDQTSPSHADATGTRVAPPCPSKAGGGIRSAA
jgi:hypothetical protein